MILGLKADDDDAAQALAQSQFTEATNGFVFFERVSLSSRRSRKLRKPSGAETGADKVVVKASFLGDAAKFIRNSGRDNGSRTGRVAVVQEQSAGWKANDSENAIECLRQHALNFTSNKAGGSKVEIGKSEHISLHAALFFFLNRHNQEHGYEYGRNSVTGRIPWPRDSGSELQEVQGKKKLHPKREGYAQHTIHECQNADFPARTCGRRRYKAEKRER